MNIILHLNELTRWSMAFGNIKNILKEEPDANIEILIHGEPLIKLTIVEANKLNIYNEMKDLSDMGVVIAACNNTMKKIGIEKDELCPFIKVVPAGVIELVKKQEEGYSYIKP
ncbi:MAG: DsrE family protein [Sarcina sp.]